MERDGHLIRLRLPTAEVDSVRLGPGIPVPALAGCYRWLCRT